jgi:hypothetical protein
MGRAAERPKRASTSRRGPPGVRVLEPSSLPLLDLLPSPCPHCGFIGPSLEPGTCGRCGIVFSRMHSGEKLPAVDAPLPDVVPLELTPRAEVLDEAPPPTANRWALPLAFAVALAVNSNGCGRLVVYASASNWAHELGHASWRWLNGRSAVPLLFVTLYSEPGRSVAVTLLVLAGLTGLFLWARREECVGLMSLAVLFFALFVAFIALPARSEHLLESFAGIFGEFWISTLWVALFYFRFPEVVPWARLRWPFLFLGACAYTRILGIFWASRGDMSLLPWGAFFGGDGDLDHLLAAGWTVATMRRVYFTTAAVCGGLLACQYVYFLWLLEKSRAGWRAPGAQERGRVASGQQR